MVDLTKSRIVVLVAILVLIAGGMFWGGRVWEARSSAVILQESRWLPLGDDVEIKVRMAVPASPTSTPTATMEPSPISTATVAPSPTASATLEPTSTPSFSYVIPDSVSKVDGYGNYSHIQPGNRLLIPSSRTAPITFKNLRGAEGHPIVITNYGGKVRINGGGNWVGISIRNCEYIRLTGTGDPSIEYGFEIFNVTNCGITTNVGEGSRYLEIDHVEIHDSGGAGIRSGQASIQTREWTCYNLYFHDNHIHDIGTTGYYVGHSRWQADGNDPQIVGIELAYNKIERTACEGVQLNAAIDDVKVHHNYIKHNGLGPLEGACDGVGLIINPGTTGDWYNNVIIEPGRHGIMAQGIGGYRIYNNLIISPGVLDPVGCGMRWYGGSGKVYNNTIVNSASYGIRVSSAPRGEIFDNIVVGSSGQDIINKDVTAYNNIIGEVGAVGFVDPGNDDFHLLAESPAVDAGSEAGFAGFDYDDVPRPQGSGADVGAFEFVGD